MSSEAPLVEVILRQMKAMRAREGEENEENGKGKVELPGVCKDNLTITEKRRRQ